MGLIGHIDLLVTLEPRSGCFQLSRILRDFFEYPVITHREADRCVPLHD